MLNLFFYHSLVTGLMGVRGRKSCELSVMSLQTLDDILQNTTEGIRLNIAFPRKHKNKKPKVCELYNYVIKSLNLTALKNIYTR